MQINNLEQMETIVAKNNSLSWDGWNVIELVKSKTAMFQSNGSFKNGSWYLKKVFSPTRDGWRIPDKYMR
jgi:hypothetical protein